MKNITINQKYAFYQRAVQDPESEIETFSWIYHDIFKKKPSRLREDFCGTFLLACEWVKSSVRNSALVLDLDPEPLRYGKKYNLSLLNQDQQRRLSILQQDVRSVTTDKPHIIAASNFSFYIFKERSQLKNYFAAAHASLDKNGILLMDMVGGKGFTEAPSSEQRDYTKETKQGKEVAWFTYFWRSHRFDPKTRQGLWGIDFQLPNKERFNGVFTYDWRVWSLSEVRSLLRQVGFSKVIVYQQQVSSDQYEVITRTPRDYCWICLVAAVK
ncbi:MAG: hypothetical protein ACOX2O_08905 [Bdellovibrionota bacterium]|jgi:hypothetical protein